MKTIIIALVTFFASLSFTANSQNTTPASSPKTDTIKVYGNCSMCKSRIEKAAKLDGVSKAQWDSGTKLLTVTYDPSKVSTNTIRQKISATGHDTDKTKADDKSYQALPGCCKYR